MKKYLALGLISSLFLTSCSSNWNKDREDGFMKKQECSKYFTEEARKAYTKEIFYSPSKNTCIAVKDTGYLYILEDALTREKMLEISSQDTEEIKKFEKMKEELK